MASTKNEIIEIIRTMPDVVQSEISELMPHVPRSKIISQIQSLYLQGTITRKGVPSKAKAGPNTVWAYAINPDPKPVTINPKRKNPTPVALDTQIADLKAQIAELIKWKEDAIERYPDLAVDPVVLQARKIVAHELRGGGDNHMADDVLAGRKDTILPMRVTIAALSR